MKNPKQENLRIFIGPVEICGIANGLVEGFSELGVSATAVLSMPHPFEYSHLKEHWLYQVWQRLGLLKNSSPRKKIIGKFAYTTMHYLWGWLVFVRALFSFDAFIFLFGKTITNSYLELWLLKRLGKKIIFIYVGSDSRPPFIDGSFFPLSNTEPSPDIARTLAKRCKRKIQLHEKFADYLVNSPATAHYHERSYINWFIMGIPKAIPGNLSYIHSSSKVVRVLHSPSNPAIKGSKLIRETVEKLQNKGHPIQLINIEGMPNKVVLHELSRCDFVIDQLYSDSPMASFATEAALFGKPAVVCGYFWDEINDYLLPDEIPPSMFVAPEALETAIEKLVLNTDFRLALGEKARQFVESRWTPKFVSERYLNLIKGNIPTTWWLNPKLVRYVNGCGIPQFHSRNIIKKMINQFGSSSLQVSDKPELEQAFIKLITEETGKFHA